MSDLGLWNFSEASVDTVNKVIEVVKNVFVIFQVFIVVAYK